MWLEGMLKHYCFLISIVLFFKNGVCQKNSSMSQLLDKFHQNDYKIKFERLELSDYNHYYYKTMNVVTFKYNRTTTAVNVSWTPTMDLPHDLDVIVQMYKFSSNEYRLFPLRVQLNLCDAYEKNVVGLQNSMKCGDFKGCPMLKNSLIYMCNWTLDERQFPPLIPNGQYMLELQGVLHTNKTFLMKSYGTVYRPFVKK